MRTFWIVQAGIGAAAIGAFAALGVACSGTIVSTGTDTATDSGSDTEIDTWTNDTDTGVTQAPTCMECACVWLAGDTPAGCGDTCTGNGTTTPNFCNGAPALSMCTMCIAARCGVDDPTMCN